ncbi:uncharacterized protein IL334_002003 [Kwoniella shivajii]|uniref:Pheromone a factor receptor n=1 Tax=Kwoniella shivajii TaxID=564305 RepID=A0ABZ1CWJ0_9TREE|nr:hypothetical protein IL334_002003 [Kwoniella shivajii]
MLHPDYPFWSFVALLLVLLPLPWHLRARNIATLSLIFWLVLANIINLVNTFIWAEAYTNHNAIWCDISSRMLLLLNYSLPACSLAQMRRLESVASTRRSIISSRDRKKRMVEEISICLIAPCFFAALVYVVQGHRYDIIENIGCVTPIYMSIPGIIIRFAVPGVVAVTSLVFAVLSIRWFLIRRLQFQTILASSDSSLSIGRYFRLIALAVADSTVLLAYAIYGATSSTDTPMQPYKSWKYVHDNFSQYAQYPEELIGSVYPAFVANNIYAPIFYSIIFFMFFGFGEEAVTEYLALAMKSKALIGKIGLKRASSTQHSDMHFKLGSKVVPAGDDSVSLRGQANDSARRSTNDDEDRREDGPGVDMGNTRRGVAVTVERSIV